MHALKILTLTLLSATIAACSTMPSHNAYSTHKSLALNLAEAGGITDLKDQVVSGEDYKKIQSSSAGVVGGAGWAAISYLNPAPGFSGGWGLGFGLLSMVKNVDVAAKHRQLVAWMPQDLASDPLQAQEKFRNILTAALDKTFTEMKWKHEPFENSRAEGDLIVASPFQTESGTCAGQSAPLTAKCIAAIYVQKPTLVESSPAFVGSTQQAPSYLFKADAIYNGYVSIVSKGHRDVDVPLFYLTLSRNLPEWAYFYIPPKSALKAHAEGNLDFPQVYYRGKLELFVRSE